MVISALEMPRQAGHHESRLPNYIVSPSLGYRMRTSFKKKKMKKSPQKNPRNHKWEKRWDICLSETFPPPNMIPIHHLDKSIIHSLWLIKTLLCAYHIFYSFICWWTLRLFYKYLLRLLWTRPQWNAVSLKIVYIHRSTQIISVFLSEFS